MCFRYKLTVFRDLFGRFTLVCSFSDKIAEGPDSFCHHCMSTRSYRAPTANEKISIVTNHIEMDESLPDGTSSPGKLLYTLLNELIAQ